MRQKRAKAYKRLMQTYAITFGFRQPYQVLVDAEFCQTICKAQVDVEKMLETVCQGKCKPMITQCSMQVLYDLGKEHQDVVDLAKRFERRKCNHREPKPNDECLTDVIGGENKHRYVLATQSVPLRNHMRAHVPALPVMHIKRGVTVLEPMSDVSVRKKKQLEQAALAEAKATALPAPPTSLAVDIVGADAADAASTAEPPKPKKKGPKGPNPLSQKKKKVPPPAPKGKGPSGAKKRPAAAPAPAPGGGEESSSAPGEKRKRPAEDDAGAGAGDADSTVKPDVVGAGGEGGEGGRKRKKRRRRTGKGAGAGGVQDGSGAESGGDD